MQIKILSPIGALLLQVEIPNNLFQGLAKGDYSVINWPIDDGPMPRFIEMSHSFGEPKTVATVSERQPARETDTSASEAG